MPPGCGDGIKSNPDAGNPHGSQNQRCRRALARFTNQSANSIFSLADRIDQGWWQSTFNSANGHGLADQRPPRVRQPLYYCVADTDTGRLYGPRKFAGYDSSVTDTRLQTKRTTSGRCNVHILQEKRQPSHKQHRVPRPSATTPARITSKGSPTNACLGCSIADDGGIQHPSAQFRARPYARIHPGPEMKDRQPGLQKMNDAAPHWSPSYSFLCSLLVSIRIS